MRATLRLSSPAWLAQPRITSSTPRQSTPGLRRISSRSGTAPRSGLGGDWELFAYNTSKGAVSNMVRAMAMDAAKDGVRVNAVNPSFTVSRMTEDMVNDPELVAEFNKRMPLGAPEDPEGVAAAMAFLASEDARLITGVNLPVDAGLMASNGQPHQ